MVTRRRSMARRDVFQAIADPNRRAIINILATQKLTMGEVADNFDISRPAISKHMKILAECGLVEYEKSGRERFCKINPEPLREVSEWVEKYSKFWSGRLDALENLLNDEDEN